MKVKELHATLQKSYYRKAFILENENNDVFLQSYDTIVCGIVNGVFERYWGDYSRTTQNHINDFRKLYNLNSLSKNNWLDIDVSNCPIGRNEHVTTNAGKYNINRFY